MSAIAETHRRPDRIVTGLGPCPFANTAFVQETIRDRK